MRNTKANKAKVTPKAVPAKDKATPEGEVPFKDLSEEDKRAFVAKKMSETLKKARTRYVAARSHTGKHTQHNGDEVAVILSSSDPATVCRVAEAIREDLSKGELAKRYGHLNAGQIRMNAGNLIRGAIRDGFATPDDVAKALAAV